MSRKGAMRSVPLTTAFGRIPFLRPSTWSVTVPFSSGATSTSSEGRTSPSNVSSSHVRSCVVPLKKIWLQNPLYAAYHCIVPSQNSGRPISLHARCVDVRPGVTIQRLIGQRTTSRARVIPMAISKSPQRYQNICFGLFTFVAPLRRKRGSATSRRCVKQVAWRGAN